ncbi:MAG: tetratricopeptide repeat protein [Gemmatimonadetes bacterium]|nr:tetratricopeptide repeat protein [Gemmatimonadota bacterium]
MKAITRLKAQARLHEQREEWEKAAQLYLQALEAGEEAAEDQDLSLFNRVGDLYLRLRRPKDAVQYFREAAERYAAAGLYNNAIALCNKALRQAPEELELYRKLGQYYAMQGFFPDARRWYLDYAERQFQLGAHDAAFSALAQFADTTNTPDVREILGRALAAHGRSAEAVQELSRAYRMRVANGEDAEALRAEIGALDAEAAAALAAETVPPAEPEPAVEVPEASDVDGIAIVSAADVAGIAAEPVAPVPIPADEALEVEPIPLDFHTNLEEFRLQGALDVPEPEPVDAAPLPDLEGLPADLGLGEGFAEIEPLPLLDLERDEADDPAAALAALDLPTLEPVAFDEAAFSTPADADGAGAEADLPLLDLPELDLAESTDAATTTDRLVPDVDEAISHTRMLERSGDVAAAIAALAELHGELAAAGRFADAAEAAAELLRLRPDDAAARAAHAAYVARAGGSADVAPGVAVGPEADAATPVAARDVEAGVAPASPAPGGDFVDLADLLGDDLGTPGSTRFTVVEHAPTGDEDRDFAEVLAQFRAKIEETIGEDDADSHYDLGLAFKEMGLLDEAITQFQSALRGMDDRLKVFEELGQCFIQKEQFRVAAIILRRALELPHEDDEALKNVYYLLGRSLEALGETAEAREAYERVIGLDLRFQDAAARLARL